METNDEVFRSVRPGSGLEAGVLACMAIGADVGLVELITGLPAEEDTGEI